MLRAIYPIAVQSGIDAEQFWEMNFEEIMVQTMANNRNKIQEMRTKAIMDHRQAEMMAFALNDPSKMPKVEEAYPFVNETKTQQTEQVPQWEKDRALLMQQAQKIKMARQAKNT